ncbi:hypothetical protein DWQ65_10335 [Treponema phagedenis]|uniref:Sporulation and cell division repeat protein n=1 Tax=Treponema phagedenis TaxID=162 RepID=A0A0B7GXV9_TREPH|nr:SPOR domain-containing protein [Treponema phagedenis]QEJ96344.1 hypothetical protein FUT79_14785 [Treponema phagedenis]QEJ99503.1 hypothetical protein FUT82_16895 [Treponema phagedenis]QEK02142.1 hypothetical protein FUT84_13890 [Treponema phagedenis]QEK05074.1 hypothetical protein FUT83_15545 [Treponema phagedenis]QEK07383.1 hypothetical protein FUT80_12070 [Treponema phagedenis]
MKKLFCVLLLCTTSVLCFAETWFVCLSSFRIEANAKRFVKVLKNNGLSAEIDKQVIGEKVFYRVLLTDPFETRQTARQKKDTLADSSYAQKLSFKGLWICTASEHFNKQYAGSMPHNRSPILTENIENIPLSIKAPYSVLVNRYKEEQRAQTGMRRLKTQGVDAYVVKTYDNTEYFSFDLHAGAFPSKEQALNLQKQLTESGVKTKSVSNYNNIKKSIVQYNTVVAAKEVTAGSGSTNIPDLFSPAVAQCIREFPINENFQIERLFIFDFDEIRTRTAELEAARSDLPKPDLDINEKTQAVSCVEYLDDLFNKRMSVIVYAGTAGAYSFTAENAKGKSLELHSPSGTLDCRLIKKEDTYRLIGINKDKNILVEFVSSDFSEKEFESLLNNSFNNSSLLVYPEVRKTLCVLPNKNTNQQRAFLFFSLTQVDPSYAINRNNADWARSVVGHWEASGLFSVENKPTYIDFFDMDYNYNAEKSHTMFKVFRQTGTSKNINNHPVKIKNANGWYANDIADGPEVSFSVMQYIVAVGNGVDAKLSEEELVLLSKDLRIWE